MTHQQPDDRHPYRSLLRLSLCLCGVLIAAAPAAAQQQDRGKRAKPTGDKPEITYAGMAAPDVVVITARAQWVEHGRQVDYEKEPGDTVQMYNQHRFVTRDGERIGALVGKAGRVLYTPDVKVGEPLDTAAADKPGNYSINAPGGTVSPESVYRKTVPYDFTRAPGKESFALDHTLILKLSEDLEKGNEYTVRFSAGLLAVDRVSFTFELSMLRSEAVHINQVGYRPDDPVKLGFLSYWMGRGGAVRLNTPGGWRSISSRTKRGKRCFRGLQN